MMAGGRCLTGIVGGLRLGTSTKAGRAEAAVVVAFEEDVVLIGHRRILISGCGILIAGSVG